METISVNAMGEPCPLPVIKATRVLEGLAGPGALEVLVDNQCSVENVTRFAESSGYKVAVAPEGQDFRLSLSK